jgi:hypothetical protein
MKKAVEKKTLAKLKRLNDIVAGLQNGEHYEITRLTTLKSLCADQKAATQFALHLAKQAVKAATAIRKPPQHLQAPVWQQHKKLMAQVIQQLEDYVKRRAKEKERALNELLTEVREVNNVYQPSRWGAIRVIQNRYVLILENCLRSVLAWTDVETGYWAYQAARDYAEQYDPCYGNGLIPQSLPMIKEIFDFWCRYYKVTL